MSIETEIQSDVEALRERFSDTKALYCEVSALLFFRHGITPTASKLYQYVRKGSMSAPTEALAKFWDDLRAKARVEIDHPDLPAELKDVAAEAIAGIWHHATDNARRELAALRIEVQAELERARGEQQRASEAASTAQTDAEALRAQIDSVNGGLREAQVDLEAERRAHAAAVARLQEQQRHLEEMREQQASLRRDFSAELAKAREAVEAANARADGAERRALLEIEQERQTRAKAEKLTEVLRSQLAQAETRQREQALAQADATGRLQAKLDAALQANHELTAAAREEAGEAQSLQAQLAQAQREALQHQTEVAAVRQLVERLAPATGQQASSPAVKVPRATKRTR